MSTTIATLVCAWFRGVGAAGLGMWVALTNIYLRGTKLRGVALTLYHTTYSVGFTVGRNILVGFLNVNNVDGLAYK